MSAPRPEKATVVDLSRYLEKGVQIKLSGGRQGTQCEDGQTHQSGDNAA